MDIILRSPTLVGPCPGFSFISYHQGRQHHVSTLIAIIQLFASSLSFTQPHPSYRVD